MDPSDFFDNATLQMSIFNENPCSVYPPSWQELPKHSLIQHLQPVVPRETSRMHGSNMSLQRNQDPILERQNLAIEMRSKVGTENNILGVKKKRMDDFNCNQNLPQVKRMRSENREQSENIGRKKRKDKNELKEQVGQLKERLVTLQEKVWRAFAQQHWSQNDRKWRNINELSEDKGIGVASEEDLFANVPKKHTGSQGPKDVLVEAGERTLGWNCTELSRGYWDEERGMVENRCQQFAQLLKVELRNVMAMVIDRVLTIYTEASEPELSSPPAVSFGAEANEKWGILKKISKRAHEMDDKESNTTRQSNQPTETTAVRTQLPPLGPSGPSLISPGPFSKDPSFSSHPSAPLAPRYPPFHPLQSMDTLPLLHYSMHQLFSKSLSHVPSPPVKNFHVNREPELERQVFCVPMPLLDLLEPPLSSPFTDRENERRTEVGIREAGGAMDLYLSLSRSQEGLSPCHLKKAKLMFFYTRYPSSNTLKTYFPDVKFSRCVTSQMIKWFSNFREFFYIQMERFARQAVQEALTQDVTHESRERQLRVGQDTELYRILNMHYNKSNVYQVPDGFIKVSEVALREFYAAIWTGRDSDPCWKKAIYKMICKLDNHVPDAFRLPGCPVG